MAISPFREAFIEVHQPLADPLGLGVLPIGVDENLLDLRRSGDRSGQVASEVIGRYGIAFAREVAKKRIPQRRLAIPAFERRTGAAAVGKAGDRGFAFGAEHELNLPELVRLESARRLES